VATEATAPDLARYKDDPAAFAKDVLRLAVTPSMDEVFAAVVSPPRRVLASSGHSVGKTVTGACLTLWWHYTRRPSLVLTTAPTERQVKDQLWREVRSLAAQAGLPDHWCGPAIPRLQTTPDHFAHGYTARDATRFQGNHSPGGVLVIFDEAEGIDGAFWLALKTMLDDNSAFVGFYNPTAGTASAAYRAEQQADAEGTFRRVTLSSLDHPNVKAGLAGLPLPVPGAITYAQARDMLLEDSVRLAPGEPEQPGDITLGTERFRPGPVALARVCGVRSKEAVTGLWSERLWDEVLATRHQVRPEWGVALGCDVGRYGDDSTVIIARKGYAVLHAESHVKQPTNVVAQRLKELCHQLKDRHNPERQIPVHVDEGGIGGGVIDQADGYLFVPVNAACSPREPEKYTLVRDELWFLGREAAQSGLLDLSRLPPAYLPRLKSELMAAQWGFSPRTGKRFVTSKDDMKAVLRRSPDIADALNLALYPPGVVFA
jgi:phage terminase large subunit